MKIYTKSGDKGKTSLASGRRVDKYDELIEAYGTVDELNAFTGLLRAKSSYDQINSELKFVQNCLFNIGALLARDGLDTIAFPAVTKEHVEYLERAIDRQTQKLAPLKNFILPAGSELIGLCHVCRTIARRAERRVLQAGELPNGELWIVVFLNRLSDYFFTLARSFALGEHIDEEIWNPDF